MYVDTVGFANDPAAVKVGRKSDSEKAYPGAEQFARSRKAKEGR